MKYCKSCSHEPGKMVRFKDFIDTTLRDGQASPLLFDTYKYYFSLEEKKQIIKGLVKLGISHLEFFPPIVNQTEKRDFLEFKKYIKSITNKKIVLIAHCRCHPEDIRTSLNVGFDGLNLYMGVSRKAQEIYGKNLNQLINLIKRTVVSARRKYPHVYLRYSVEDTFRTSLKNIYRVYDEVCDYVDTLGMPDTTGVATPTLVREKVRALKKRYPKNNLECHFHNDCGYALINTVTAIENGVEYADTSIWGLAERSGIASITGVLLNLYHLNKDYVRNYRLNLCYPLNVLMGSILQVQVPYNEPVSLTNRTHIAGVHQKAVLSNKKSYEAHSLEKFGVTKDHLLLGPLTGWNFIYYYLKEVKNYVLSREMAKLIASDFKKEISKINQKTKPEDLLEEIVKRKFLIQIGIPKEYQVKRLENLNK